MLSLPTPAYDFFRPHDRIRIFIISGISFLVSQGEAIAITFPSNLVCIVDWWKLTELD